MAETPVVTEVFKAPELIPSPSNTTPEEIDAKTTAKCLKQENVAEPTKSDQKTKKKQQIVPLPYKEPDWGGPPPPTFNFEVIKNGTFVSTIPIRSSFFVFGRLDVCDVSFDHPSVSRYHAIVQYCKGDDLHPKGFYLYDLGSTHGTFLNKNPVKSKIYYKLKVGYVLKFGGSSRLHIFQGPEEVEEDEEKKPAPASEAEREECNWGMDDEDAEEEEESTVNPFALSTSNEDLYLDDPKKTLRGWFEREGYDLEYHVEEKGFKTFMCTVKLPVDTPTGEFLPVEASVSGKKKEAVVACALEACRTLDRLGLLRQSHQESRQRKRKKWEENDYYDSDEDTFYDRTGEIEKRREMRKKLANKTKAENFQTLETKLKDLVSEIDEIRQKLNACSAKGSKTGDDDEDDSLETYMSSLAASANAPTDKFQRRKLMLRLSEAEKEKVQVEKMLNIAKPAALPPVSKHPGMIGKKPKSKPHLAALKPKAAPKVEESTADVEEESDVETNDDQQNDEKSDLKKDNDNLPSPEKMQVDECDTSNKVKKYGLVFPSQDNVSEKEKDNSKQDNVSERGKDNSKQDNPSCNDSEMSTDSKNDSLPAAEKRSSDRHEIVENKDVGDQSTVPKPKPCKKTNKKPKSDVDVYKTETAEYSTWTPPANQSGDGITHLNAKYGY